MSIVVQIGKGLPKKCSFRSALGGLSIVIDKGMENKTLTKIAKQLAKERGMKNGEIVLYDITFNFRMEKEDDSNE